MNAIHISCRESANRAIHLVDAAYSSQNPFSKSSADCLHLLERTCRLFLLHFLHPTSLLLLHFIEQESHPFPPSWSPNDQFGLAKRDRSKGYLRSGCWCRFQSLFGHAYRQACHNSSALTWVEHSDSWCFCCQAQPMLVTEAFGQFTHTQPSQEEHSPQLHQMAPISWDSPAHHPAPSQSPLRPVAFLNSILLFAFFIIILGQ